MNAVEASGLTRRFGSLEAVGDLSITVRRGELFALVGPNGAGKTTLLRMLCGVLTPSEGSLEVLGRRLPQELHRIKGAVGYLSQSFSLYGDLSVDENVEFFARIYGVRDWKPRRDELLEFTRLSEFRRRLADRLSGGMRQKLALACTLVHQPELILLDEPTTGVDPVSRRDFWTLLARLQQGGTTLILTTPYMDEAERAGMVGLLDGGRLLASGPPAALRARVGASVTQLFCTDNRKAWTVLRAAEVFGEVQLFGDRVDLLSSRATAVDEARRLLSDAGIDVRDHRVTAPGLENLFISVIRAQRVAAGGAV